MSIKPRILYVDDEPENLKVFERVFRTDFAVTTTESPEAALRILESDTYDIVLSDQRMPSITGVDFLGRLYSMGIDSIRILLTGYSDIRAIIEAINRGHVYYYCTKPWGKEELTVLFLKAFEYVDLSRRNQRLLNDLAKTVKELDTFLYKASHNLKTPITSQLGLISLLKHDIPGENAEIVQKMQESVTALEKTIDKMQALSHSGYEFMGERYVVDVRILIDESINLFEELVTEKGIAIEVACNIGNEAFHSDPQSIKHVLGNVLENAFTYTQGAQPKVNVQASTYTEQGTVLLKLVVEDNGIGIDPSVIGDIFNPFFRGTNASSGSGLGLFVAKKILDSLQGRIEVKSQGAGGTTVEIVIPSMMTS